MRREQFSVNKLIVGSIENQYGSMIYPGPNPSGGMDYYVENNYGANTYDGLSWDTPFKTLAKAIAVSNTYIAASSKGWAARNRIFYRADTETADLVVFPNKCDVIGVGSYDANDMPGITGNHVPANAGNYGSRFFNIFFKAPADASPIVTLASTSSGIQFHGCIFSATATTTIGIQATASPFLKVKNCRFEGAFVTAALSFGAGEAGSTEIVGNDILQSAAVGILINASTTASWPFIIKDNLIEAATLIIDDNSDSGTGIVYVTGNKLISLAASTTAYTENMDINLGRAAGNYLTTPNIATVYPILDTTT